MKTVFREIDLAVEAFAQHRFFRRTENAACSLRNFRDAMEALSFWVLAYQDLLDINAKQIQDPMLALVARRHRHEEQEHAAWYLRDMALQGANGAEAAFRASPPEVRRATYRILGRACSALSDTDRIVLLFCLEAASHVFLLNASNYTRRRSAETLEYFSGAHLQVELAHAAFDESLRRSLRATTLDSIELARAVALVFEIFCAFDLIFDALDAVAAPVPDADAPAMVH